MTVSDELERLPLGPFAKLTEDERIVLEILERLYAASKAPTELSLLNAWRRMIERRWELESKVAAIAGLTDGAAALLDELNETAGPYQPPVVRAAIAALATAIAAMGLAVKL